MHEFGIVRIGLATPPTVVANPRANTDAILKLVNQAEDCDVLVFPELCLSGYTCGDLFQQRRLQDDVLFELDRLLDESGDFDGLLLVGLPLGVGSRLFNVAAVVHHGRLLGIVPKQHIPNYKEFYEHRWFATPRGDEPATITVCEQTVPFGVDLLFACRNMPDLVLGVEICEDLWVPIPPSSMQAQAGATVLANLSASNESTAKSEYRKQLVLNQSARCIAGYVYSSCGVHESSTDLVFGGHALAAESGTLIAEGDRFVREPRLVRADIDVERLNADRRQMSTFADFRGRDYRRIEFSMREKRVQKLYRFVPARPFVPAGGERLHERCHEIFEMQIAGLAKRLEVVRPPRVQIGISGGLDSTLALLVAAKTYDRLGWPRSQILGITMPGFGTSTLTHSNALRLMELLQIQSREMPIRQLSKDLFDVMDHEPFGIQASEMSLETFIESLRELPEDKLHDLVFENVQARIRTLLLMSHGFVIGTGDLSELALGWSTYNGDHMSMYNPNASIPKTLVRFLIQWVADNEFDGEIREVLYSIVGTEISPELLPAGRNRRIQSTEDAIGPYELHDFFLYHMIRFGYRPKKIRWLASFADFEGKYTAAEIRKCQKTFYQRFFANQYKRSCLPDGPKVGSISLSPRGDWRMPSDADAAQWLREVDE